MTSHTVGDRRGWAAWSLFGLVLAYGVWQVFQFVLNHDVAFFLLQPRAPDTGRGLYETFRDFNTPANYWLPHLSVAMARATSLTLADAHRILLLVIVTVTAALTGALVRRMAEPGSVTAFAAPALFAAAFVVLPGYDFGQREALFAAGAAPLVAVILTRRRGLGVPFPAILLVALLAAVSAAQKPHFMAALGALGLVELAFRRGRIAEIGLELWLTALFLFVLAGGIVYADPTYVTSVLPRAATLYAQVGRSFGSVAFDLATMPRVLQAAAMIVTLSVLVRARGLLPEATIGLWLAIIGISGALYIVQRQGFYYHLLVLEIALSAGIGLLALRWIDGLAASSATLTRNPWAARAAALVPLAFVMAHGLLDRPFGSDAAARRDPLVQRLRDLPPGEPILSLQTGVPPISPLHAYADVTWSGPVATLVALRPILDDRLKTGEPRDRFLRAEESLLRQDVLDSLRDPAPTLVFVEVGQPLRWFEDFPRPVSILDVLAEAPEFRAAWAGYRRERQIRTIFGLEVDVYRRAPVP